MQFILTHEQSDFDALAALYAAALLDGGVAVLPRRVNRNVRAFLTLYGQEFPFTDPRDLPQGAVESVTLVDTQGLITLKGMGKDTKVTIYDHHPARSQAKSALERGFAADWNVITFDLGATTTYFVEILQERGNVLTTIQASLLLLGIYEDTGTLTYSRTTARDIYAAGWLLEQGADLGLINDFLNPPLSAEQREVYDRLVAGIESFDIHGHKIMLACGEAAGVTDEISTLAHKLRDAFDPDALFVVVKTAEGVRLVARSGTDEIDVSLIAAHFGGGGHNRAAAALIRSLPGVNDDLPLLSETRELLLGVLDRFVRPAVTVAHLMSKLPRAIAADTTVQEAAKLMARYGYEGFPVVDNGRVLGLLTRRAVDRAINHRLNLTAASLMEGGSITVFPTESVQRLQTVMQESGWGQIPVVEPDTLKIVGIVTRTDLLKTLAHRHIQDSVVPSLSEKIKKSLSYQRLGLIQAVAEEAAVEHLPIYIVGGFVRDLFLETPSADFDMVVEGDAIALGGGLVKKFGGKLTSHARFGTAKWFLKGSQFSGGELPEFLDLISARQEFYAHPSALPTVEHSSIKLDLHRRDFTINTLALRLDGRHFGELHDYYGGVADLNRKQVRVLHSLSFVDDPTRMLRAVRYEQRYHFEIEQRTEQLMDESLLHVDRLSDERVRHELDQILAEARAIPMLARLDELGLLKAIAAELPWNSEVRERLESALSQPVNAVWENALSTSGVNPRERLLYCLWLVGLSKPAVESLHARLRFPISTLKEIIAALELSAELAALRGAKPSRWVSRLDTLPLLAVYAVYLSSPEIELDEYISRWRNIHAFATGDTLRAHGLQPGPNFQVILSRLRNAWLDGELKTAADEELLLSELLKQGILPLQ